jgi:hypothetical protein
MNVGSWATIRWRFLGVIGAAVVLFLLGASLATRVYGRWRLEGARGALEARGVSFETPYDRTDPPRTKAADWLAAGAGATIVPPSSRRVLVRAGNTPWHNWDIALDADVGRLLADNDCALSLLHRLTTMPRGPLPRTPSVYSASTLLGIEAQYRLAHGDASGALLAARTLAVMPENGSRELIELAFRVATAPNDRVPGRDFLKDLRELLPTDDLPAATRRQIASAAAAWYHKARSASLDELFDQPGVPPWARQLLSFAVTELYASAVLDEYGESMAIIDRGEVVAPRPTASYRRSLVHWVRFRAVRFPVNRYQGPFMRRLQGRRELVRAALELRGAALDGQAYPPARPSVAALDAAESLLRESFVYAVQPDGSLALSKRLVVEEAVRLPAPPAKRVLR